MKFNLKESLIKYNLLKEGWMQDLEGQYDEDLLIFVGRMLQKIYGSENIENHKLAPWIAGVTKTLGKAPYDIDANNMKSAVHAFEMILNYIKSENDSEESISNITSKDPRAAYAYAKEELEKEDGPKYSEVVDRMIDNGTIRVVKEVSNNRVWVEVLDRSFFDEADGGSLFGISCQNRGGPGANFVGGDFKTYTLLSKDGDKFDTLSSIAIDTNNNAFKEIKQAGNIPPGKSSVKGFSDLAEVTSDFMIDDLGYIDKYYNWGGSSVPSRCGGSYGASSTFCWWLNNKPSVVEKLLKNTDALNAMEPLVRNTKPDFLEALIVDYDELLKNNPDKFFNRLNVYLSNVKDDLEELLKDFDFKNYTKSQSGSEALFKALPILIENLPFDFFKDKIYPYINFGAFLSKMGKSEIEATLRSIRNKFGKNTKLFLSEFDKMFEDFAEGFGGGLKGFGALSTLLNMPRLDIHQNFRKVDGEVVASTERPLVDDGGNMVTDEMGNREMTLVDIKVPEDDKVLGAKNIRVFYKKNEDWIKSKMTGSDEEKDIKFLRYILTTSSSQAKQSSLKKEKDKFIEYYNKQYKEGKSELPGVVVLNTLMNPKSYQLTNKNKFSTGINCYKFDKKELKSNDLKALVELLRYYISKSNSKTLGRKIGDAISAIVDTLKTSSFSKEEINEIILDKFFISKIDKSLNYYSIANWVTNLLPFVKDGTIDRKSIAQFLESDKVKDIVAKDSKISASIEYSYKDLLKKLNGNSLDESDVRNYIQNLLISNFKK
tara:strand:+ start:489 stop:2798 length:2310 start_codon:yes stop_codon:yes gene_type:complete